MKNEKGLKDLVEKNDPPLIDLDTIMALINNGFCPMSEKEFNILRDQTKASRDVQPNKSSTDKKELVIKKDQGHKR